MALVKFMLYASVAAMRRRGRLGLYERLQLKAWMGCGKWECCLRLNTCQKAMGARISHTVLLRMTS
jgi:predicted component of type VI protein secretion system